MRISLASVAFGVVAILFCLLMFSFSGALASAVVLGHWWSFVGAFAHMWIAASLMALFAWLSEEAAKSKRLES